MRMKLFKYGYLIRYAFDLGRIFPLIEKQPAVIRMVSRFHVFFIDAGANISSSLFNLGIPLQGFINETRIIGLSALRVLGASIPLLQNNSQSIFGM